MYKLLSVVTDQVKQHTVWDYLIRLIGASLSEPHTGQMASPAMFICIYLSIYVCMYRTSFRKCPHILIYWTASILLSVIQFRKFTTFK